jgi:hypothetical protein
MLTRHALATTLLACLAALTGNLILAAPGQSRADPTPQPSGGAGCDPTTNPWCHVEDGKPGRGGGGGSGGGTGCTWNGQQMPCQDPDFGYYVGGGCYWKRLDPPPAGLTPPEGKDPAKGAWGVRTCYASPGSNVVQQVYSWMDNPPGGPTPAALARQALAKLHLLGAQIGITPDPNGSGSVGLPVWLWTAVTPGTWGPQSASATSGGITVTITARAQRIVWSMGDRGSVTCDNPGTPYEARYGNSMSPTCGYRYSAPSATQANPNSRYTVTATTYWRVDWSGGGQSGVLTPTSQSQTSVRIGEIPVVVGRRPRQPAAAASPTALACPPRGQYQWPVCPGGVAGGYSPSPSYSSSWAPLAPTSWSSRRE